MRGAATPKRCTVLSVVNHCREPIDELNCDDTLEECVLKLHYIPDLPDVEAVASLMATIRKHLRNRATDFGTIDTFELDQVVTNITQIPELLDRFSDNLVSFLKSLVDIPWYQSHQLADPGFYIWVLEEILPRVRSKELVIAMLSAAVQKWGNCNDFFNTLAGPLVDLLAEPESDLMVDAILFTFAEVMTIADNQSIINSWPIFDILTKMINSQVESPGLFGLLNAIIKTEAPYQFLTRYVRVSYPAVYQMLENPELKDDCRLEILRMIELSIICNNIPAIDTFEWRYILVNLEHFSEESLVQMCKCVRIGGKKLVKIDEFISLNPLPIIFDVGSSGSHNVKCAAFGAISRILQRGWIENVVETLQELDYIQSLVDFMETSESDDTSCNQFQIMKISLRSLLYIAYLIRDRDMDSSFIADLEIDETIERRIDELSTEIDPESLMKLIDLNQSFKALLNPSL